MEKEKLKIRLASLKEKVLQVEDLVEGPYSDCELEFELQDLEEELDRFRFSLEERVY